MAVECSEHDGARPLLDTRITARAGDANIVDGSSDLDIVYSPGGQE